MATINKNYNNLSESYLFSTITRKVKEFTDKNPGIKVMRLGVGNTTESLTPSVIKGLKLGVSKLADVKSYTGYGDEQGDIRLREALKRYYGEQGIKLSSAEIFISDGAKSDCANILSIFGEKSIVAIADPVYPVYLDSAVASGKKVQLLKCKEKKGFIPDLPKGKIDLIFICSPNNPTGAVFTKAQLKKFVEYARKNSAVIIFDAAYAEYIQDKDLPRSIYEIKGASSCVIEINSFSKWAGFTGVRLGWTVVPMDLAVEGEKPGRVNQLWNRRQTTMFNGASNVAQEGGLAVLSQEGLKECKKLVGYYMENAKIIKKGLSKLGLKVFGGENAPYIWLKVPAGMSSWDFFDKLLKETHVVGTPGSGFGKEGEGYLRLSAFGHRENIVKAVKSIENNLV